MIGRCRAFTWTSDNVCHLKEATPNFVPFTALGVTATSGLTSGATSTLEAGYDRGGAAFSIFDYTSSDFTCTKACSDDYRCQALTIEKRAGGVKRCSLKSVALDPVANPSFSSVARRGLEMQRARVGSVLSSFQLNFHTPELCQSECSKTASCRSWRYSVGDSTTPPTCFLQSDTPAASVSTSTVSGLKSLIYR